MHYQIIIRTFLAALTLFLVGCCSPLQPIPEGVEVVPLTQHPLFPLELVFAHKSWERGLKRCRKRVL
jgi:hypothetical protein